MKAQWIILIWVTLTAFFAAKPKTSPDIPEITEHRATKSGAFLVFVVPVLIIGLRYSAGDTSGYIRHFKSLPPGGTFKTFEQFLKFYSKGPRFYRIAYYFKRFVSTDYHFWLLAICAFCAFCLVRLFQKYSPDFRLTAYLYITSCFYTWLMNGIRQYFAVCFLMLFIEFGLSKKIWMDAVFVWLVFLMVSIHTSSYIMIPIYFLAARQKALTRKTNIILIISIIVIIVLVLTGVYGSFVDDTEYSNDVVYYKDNPGTNIYRVVLNSIPAILVILNYKKVKEKMTPFIGILVNMSFITAGLYVFSMFKMGMLEGRLPAFTEVYNIILYPWIIKYVYKDSKLFYAGLILGYLGFFYYQMVISWNGLGYYSDILKLLN